MLFVGAVCEILKSEGRGWLGHSYLYASSDDRDEGSLDLGTPVSVGYLESSVILVLSLCLSLPSSPTPKISPAADLEVRNMQVEV